ncbi:MAG: hypothetical protein ACR2GY_08145 [Phycisphaerales bacterium]
MFHVAGLSAVVPALAVAFAGLPALAEPLLQQDAPERPRHLQQSYDPDAAGCVVDAGDIFTRLISRYQQLEVYEDDVVIEQVTARDGEPAQVEETTVRCAINENGRLAVTRPVEKAGHSPLGLDGLLCGVGAEAMQLQYDLWLAPHMGLRFMEDPLANFRAGIDEGFTATHAERVRVQDEDMLRLDLQSGDGISGDFRARFEIFIDPETLLIQRVRGVQVLPDGANLLTNFIITPRVVVG